MRGDRPGFQPMVMRRGEPEAEAPRASALVRTEDCRIPAPRRPEASGPTDALPAPRRALRNKHSGRTPPGPRRLEGSVNVRAGEAWWRKETRSRQPDRRSHDSSLSLCPSERLPVTRVLSRHERRAGPRSCSRFSRAPVGRKSGSASSTSSSRATPKPGSVPVRTDTSERRSGRCSSGFATARSSRAFAPASGAYGPETSALLRQPDVHVNPPSRALPAGSPGPELDLVSFAPVSCPAPHCEPASSASATQARGCRAQWVAGAGGLRRTVGEPVGCTNRGLPAGGNAFR